MPKTLGKNLNLCFKKMINSQASPPHEEGDHSHFLMKSFNSLYDPTTSFEPYTATPDFATAYASQRFFFSSPGRSNSIVDSTSSLASTSSSSLLPEHDTLSGGIAVPTLSPDPYLDFFRSMQDMVEAYGLTDLKTNYNNLHELFRCYLSLNPKSTHKYIVRAFTDLLISLMTTSPPLECGLNRQHDL
ncbi:Transcription repressor [Heracleum sosnowskyi]|uniref:Transcription repressor n=1 Tax=Heracleum sosnowskyi TaxID=360622 RepID=A0AAD8LW19_9APIA|nr:Transcription repressor [Heracleum sosnowskyi]